MKIKQVIALFLSLVMLLALCACQSQNNANTETTGGETTGGETTGEETTTEEETTAEETTAASGEGSLPTVEQMYADLEGLNVLALGDSLFYGSYECVGDKVWVNLLGEEMAWSLTNLGIGGATVSLTPNNATANKISMYDRLFNTDTYYFGSNVDYRYYNTGFPQLKKNTDVELILFEGGCNDYGYAIAAPLGTVDDNCADTFLGAWNAITQKLLQDYPNATIVFVTPWELNGSQSRPDGMASIPFTRSIVTLYEQKYADNDRVFLIDAGDPTVSGVNMNNSSWKSQHSYDNYHLKESGMKIMAENMLPYIWDIVINRTK